MMISRDDSDRARAISTSCCSATESTETDVSGSTSSPTRSTMPRVSARIRRQSTRPSRVQRRAADEDVLGDAERRDQAELLVDRHDAELPGLDRTLRREAGAGEGHPAAGGGLRARQDLEQGGLAGAVLAEQAMHLAGAHVERHVVQRGHADEPLAEADRPRAAARRASRACGRASAASVATAIIRLEKSEPGRSAVGASGPAAAWRG